MAFHELISTWLKVGSSAKTLWHKFANNNSVRTTRSRIIHLKNDYKALMNVIEKTVQERFAELAQQQPEATESSSSQPSEARPMATRPAPLDPAFAKVNSVVPGSPADTAGLKPGDEIRNFGYVNRSNNDGLKRVADCVQGNEGVSTISLNASIPLLSDTANLSLLIHGGYKLTHRYSTVSL
jgi:C-terminal processing protease CtpA/Prc